MNTDFNDNDISKFSFLEFGAISSTTMQKEVYDFKTNSYAYDWYMHARYSHDMYTYLSLMELSLKDDQTKIGNTYLKEIHHFDDFTSNLKKLTALSLFENQSFFEYGQTLFGCIEGIDFCKKLLKNVHEEVKLVNLKNVKWHGFDISPFFNKMAKVTHGAYKVTTSNNQEIFSGHYDTFFAKGVTLLYALRTTSDFFNLTKNSRIGLFDYSFSPKQTRIETIGTGKDVCFLGINEFLNIYNKLPQKIYVRQTSHYDRKQEKIYVDAIIGDTNTCELFMKQDQLFRESLCQKYPNLSQALLKNEITTFRKWTELNQFYSNLDFS